MDGDAVGTVLPSLPRELTLSDLITEIRLEPGSGDLTVETADTKQVEIRRMVRYRSTEPDTSYEDRVKSFCRALYGHRPFLRDFEPFVADVTVNVAVDPTSPPGVSATKALLPLSGLFALPPA